MHLGGGRLLKTNCVLLKWNVNLVVELIYLKHWLQKPKSDALEEMDEEGHFLRRSVNDITSRLDINFGSLARPSRGGRGRGGRGGATSRPSRPEKACGTKSEKVLISVLRLLPAMKVICMLKRIPWHLELSALYIYIFHFVRVRGGGVLYYAHHLLLGLSAFCIKTIGATSRKLAH